MKKDKIVFGVLILIVIVALILAFTNKKENEPMVEDVFVEESTMTTESGYVAEKSEITWSANKKIVREWVDQGTIEASSAILEVNQQGAPVAGSIILDMTSLDVTKTGSNKDFERLETHVSSADFFDVEKYPTASFVVTEVSEGENGTYILTGDMTIKETTKVMDVPVTLSTNQEGHRVVGTLAIDRTEYDVRFGSDKFFDNLGNNVIDDIFTVSFDLFFAL